jgi:hypothetical protein
MTLLRASAIVSLIAIITCSALAQQLPRKKLIQTGWDQLSPQRLRQHLDLVEQRPFHGQVIRFNSRDDEIQFRLAFDDREWDMDAIEQIIEDLQIAQEQSTRPAERFLLINANPGDVDWFDDEGWATIVEHWRIAARVARECDLDGILFDPEAYHKPARQFGWAWQPQHEQHSFMEYHQKARQRGAEVMAAVAGEYPDMILFCYFMNSVNSVPTQRAEPLAALAGSKYDLLPGFIDGWLDAAPPGVTFVDGCEPAYRFNSREQYLEAYKYIKSDCQRLVSPENRAKYRAQVQVGFGFYLDTYINPPGDPWYVDPMGMERVERLGRNLSHALEVTDEYVWVYGEKASWWPTPRPRSDHQRWPEALPGIVDEIRAAADPAEFVQMKITEAGDDLANLAVNGDFQAGSVDAQGPEPEADWAADEAPPGWSFWQFPTSEGAPAWDREVGHDQPGSARMNGVTTGSTLQKIPVEAGRQYAVSAWRKIEGDGHGGIRVRWQTPENEWHVPHLDVTLDAAGPREEWVQIAGVVTPPEGAGFLVPLLNASGQTSMDDAIWYDDVIVFPLD